MGEMSNMFDSQRFGVIVRYYPDRGYGFIMSDGKRYFFHITQYTASSEERLPVPQQRVYFTPVEYGDKPKAKQVVPVDCGDTLTE